jgi:hypothetical protein
MIRKARAFFVSGALAGVLTVAAGTSSLTLLVFGVGPLFCFATLAAMHITGGLPSPRVGLWRLLGAVFVSTATYVLSLFVFSIVLGYSPQLFGVQQSSDIVQFRADVWLGLLAASFVAAVGIEAVAAFLVGRWKISYVMCFFGAGFTAILITFIANLQFHRYWSFLGILLPVGEMLFCGVIGMQVLGVEHGSGSPTFPCE